ncbi:MAG TPA: LiaF-related protein [Bacillota bacterium]|nr:LiaF-related protein [Bacillota bacterium]
MGSRIAKGLLIVLIGVILLLNTTGILAWSVWRTALGLWPIIIIGIGLHLIFPEKKVPWIALSLIVILVVATISSYYVATSHKPWGIHRVPKKANGAVVLEHKKVFSVPVDPETSFLHVTFISDALALDGEGDPELDNPDSRMAMHGELYWDKEEPLVNISLREDAGVRVSVASPSAGVEDRKDLRYVCIGKFNPGFATQIDIAAGTADIDLDATSFHLSQLSLATAVADVRLVFGLTGKDTRVSIASGVVNTEVIVPQDAGVRVFVSSAPIFTQVKFEELEFTKQGNTWASKNFSSASTKIDFQVDCGIGSITVKKAP